MIVNKEDVIKAWATIRTENNTIPDDVLNFMKDSSIKIIEEGSISQLLEKTITQKIQQRGVITEWWRDEYYDGINKNTEMEWSEAQSENKTQMQLLRHLLDHIKR